MERAHLETRVSELEPIVVEPTGRTAAGWPYLSEAAWTRFRDWVPHLFAEGDRTWQALDELEARHGTAIEDAVSALRRVLRTSVATAPAECWMLRQALSELAREGWIARWCSGPLEVPTELEPEAALLLARGYLVRAGPCVRWSDAPTAKAVADAVTPLPSDRPAWLSNVWLEAIQGDAASLDVARGLCAPVQTFASRAPSWVATMGDLELGYRLVPLVIALRASALPADEALANLPTDIGAGVVALFEQAGWRRDGTWSPLGQRALDRGPGPYGIIEAYAPYIPTLADRWKGRVAGAHVRRAANLVASQDANQATFRRANDAIDRFCEQTGFAYDVFVEHAVGRGEATRQRFARDGEKRRYVGADLESAAIDAAKAEQAEGRLPENMRFVQADIGRPDDLVCAMRSAGVDPHGAVMVVGNGFHEVRDQTDDGMVNVFRGYERAGIVLVFTEESALSIRSIVRTAWNTYHAAFRYVHDLSGQGLRPAEPAHEDGMGIPLRASWRECALQAGYVRVRNASPSARRIFPFTPLDGRNPTINVNHFFVPGALAAELGLRE